MKISQFIISIIFSLLFLVGCTDDDNKSNTTDVPDNSNSNSTDVPDNLVALVPPTSANVLRSSISDNQTLAKFFGLRNTAAAFEDADSDYSNYETIVIDDLEYFTQVDNIDYFLCALRYAGGAIANDDGYNFKVDLQLCDVNSPGYIEGVATASRIDDNSPQNYRFFFTVYEPDYQISYDFDNLEGDYLEVIENGYVDVSKNIAALEVTSEADETNPFGEFELVMQSFYMGETVSVSIQATVPSAGVSEIANLFEFAYTGELYTYDDQNNLEEFEETFIKGAFGYVATTNDSAGTGDIYSNFSDEYGTYKTFAAYNNNFIKTTYQFDIEDSFLDATFSDDFLQETLEECWNRSESNSYAVSYALFNYADGSFVDTTDSFTLAFVVDNQTIEAEWYGYGEYGFLFIPFEYIEPEVADDSTDTVFAEPTYDVDGSWGAEVSFDAGTVDVSQQYVLKPELIINPSYPADISSCDQLTFNTEKVLPDFEDLTFTYDDMPVVGDDANYVLNGELVDN